VRASPVARVTGGWYRRNGFDGNAALTWGGVAGVVSGGALAVACGTVADNCGNVLASMSLTSGAAGLLAGAATGAATIRIDDVASLAQYARFPMGKPLGVVWADLRRR